MQWTTFAFNKGLTILARDKGAKFWNTCTFLIISISPPLMLFLYCWIMHLLPKRIINFVCHFIFIGQLMLTKRNKRELRKIVQYGIYENTYFSCSVIFPILYSCFLSLNIKKWWYCLYVYLGIFVCFCIFFRLSVCFGLRMYTYPFVSLKRKASVIFFSMW